MARNFSCAVTDNIKDWEWAVLTGDIWKAHGAAVARARPYIPGSYDQPPRNIAEKISSGYKAKEWQGFLWSRPRSPLQSSSQAVLAKLQASIPDHNKRMNNIKTHNEIETKKVTHGGHTAEDGLERQLLTKPITVLFLWRPFSQRLDLMEDDRIHILFLETSFHSISMGLSALDERIRTVGKAAMDPTLRSFLKVLQHLRAIILQDSAILFTKYPQSPLWRHPPFNTPKFRFASTAHVVIRSAHEEARLRLENLPEAVATSFHGMVTTNHIPQELARDELREATAQLRAIQEHLRTPPDAPERQQRKKKGKTVQAVAIAQEAPPSLPNPS
ncbi:hypothetical protein FPV67DRAFT_1662983 [Lyophyllum atratum]|nr:hypothetical protein FPV67DRAFT_1662983 [Lyophyllum atratum]